MGVFGKSLFIRFDNHSNDIPTWPPQKDILDAGRGQGVARRAEERKDAGEERSGEHRKASSRSGGRQVGEVERERDGRVTGF